MQERNDNAVPLYWQEFRCERSLRLAAQADHRSVRGLLRAADELKRRRRGRLAALAAGTVIA